MSRFGELLPSYDVLVPLYLWQGATFLLWQRTPSQLYSQCSRVVVGGLFVLAVMDSSLFVSGSTYQFAVGAQAPLKGGSESC